MIKSLTLIDTAADAEATIYEFGAISIAFRIPLAGPIPSLRGLAPALWNNAALATEARAAVEELMRELGGIYSVFAELPDEPELN